MNHTVLQGDFSIGNGQGTEERGVLAAELMDGHIL
jgi:hypothetical protein